MEDKRQSITKSELIEKISAKIPQLGNKDVCTLKNDQIIHKVEENRNAVLETVKKCFIKKG